MPRLFMIRVFLSSSDLPGMQGYYSLFLPEKACAGLIPIPDRGISWDKMPSHLDPCKAVEPCTGLKYEMLQPIEYKWVLHRDPRIDLGFYTDSRFARARSDDILLFTAGLAEYPNGFWGQRRWSIREIRRVFLDSVRKGKAGVYVVGGIVVEKVLDISRLKRGWREAVEKTPMLKYSPHYHRGHDLPRAFLGKGFTLKPPLPISRRVEGRLAGPPTRLLKKLLGEEKALAYARKKYRKSSGGVEIAVEDVLSTLEEEGAKIVYSQ